MGNDFILNACGGFGDCTGTLIDSISLTVPTSQLKVMMGLIWFRIYDRVEVMMKKESIQSRLLEPAMFVH